MYSVWALLAVGIFALVHLFAEKTRNLDEIVHGRFLSFCGGVAIAYVFIDILPKLAANDLIIQRMLSGVFPYVERHIYVMALVGFLMFFIINRSETWLIGRSKFYISVFSYAWFNFLVGYAVVDKNNIEVQPLILFTFAMTLHLFTNDYSLNKLYGDSYRNTGRWILIASLFLGWSVGMVIILPEVAVALISAFIGGGVILNVTRHELPQENPHSLGAFLASAFLYTIILLLIGAKHGHG